MSDTPTTPAGWYDDGSGSRRYWDGAAWTEYVETPPAPPTPASEAPTEAYGQPPTPPYGAAPTPPYGAAPTAPYGAAPTAPYGANPSQYGAPTGYAPPRTPQPADAKPSVVGLIALGIAVIGLILAFIPLAGLGAALLLPVALVLAIVAFFLRGRKWPAITALIVSVVGGIAAVVVFLVSALFLVGQTISDLPDFPDTDSTVAPPSDDSADTPDDTPDDDAAAGGEVGSIENPAPIGATVSGDEYDVVINSVTLGADAEVLAASSVNGPAPEGLSYAVVNTTITYTGAASGFGLFVLVDYLAPDGTSYSFADTAVVPPDPQIGFDELAPGASTTGNIVLAIPTAADGVLSVSPGVLADPVYVSLR